jgi:predicted RNA binding protein YcfA (HicA-like mRNA interferase family)
MRVREVIDLLLEDGWFLHKTTGGHRQFKHKKKGGKVTVPGGMGESLPLKTLKSIFTQAQWR